MIDRRRRPTSGFPSAAAIAPPPPPTSESRRSGGPSCVARAYFWLTERLAPRDPMHCHAAHTESRGGSGGGGGDAVWRRCAALRTTACDCARPPPLPLPTTASERAHAPNPTDELPARARNPFGPDAGRLWAGLNRLRARRKWRGRRARAVKQSARWQPLGRSDDKLDLRPALATRDANE